MPKLKNLKRNNKFIGMFVTPDCTIDNKTNWKAVINQSGMSNNNINFNNVSLEAGFGRKNDQKNQL